VCERGVVGKAVKALHKLLYALGHRGHMKNPTPDPNSSRIVSIWRCRFGAVDPNIALSNVEWFLDVPNCTVIRVRGAADLKARGVLDMVRAWSFTPGGTYSVAIPHAGEAAERTYPTKVIRERGLPNDVPRFAIVENNEKQRFLISLVHHRDTCSEHHEPLGWCPGRVPLPVDVRGREASRGTTPHLG